MGRIRLRPKLRRWLVSAAGGSPTRRRSATRGTRSVTSATKWGMLPSCAAQEDRDPRHRDRQRHNGQHQQQQRSRQPEQQQVGQWCASWQGPRVQTCGFAQPLPARMYSSRAKIVSGAREDDRKPIRSPLRSHATNSTSGQRTRSCLHRRRHWDRERRHRQAWTRRRI